MFGIIPLLVLIVFFLITSLRVLNEYERGVIFRLGRVIQPKGPGLIILLPILDRMTKVSLRTFALDVPNQDVITRDTVSIKVNAVVYFRVVDPIKSILEVEDYMYATSQISQTTLRSVCGGVELDEILHQELHEIEAVGASGVSRELDPLPGRQAAEHLAL